MAVLRENDFDAAAGRAVDHFLSGNAKLADAVANEAIQGGMNPDQIERLVQAANTMAFLKMMDARKNEGAGDLLHEFDPTDARHIIQMIVNAEDVPHHDPSMAEMGGAGPGPAASDDLPDEMSAVRRAPDVSDEKAPPEKGDEKKKERDEAKKEKEAGLKANRLRKLAGVLEDQFRQAELAFEDRCAELQMHFRRAHKPLGFDDFEKDALAEHGSDMGIHILNAMREERGLSPMPRDTALTKVAALQDRHLSDDTEELRLFGQIVKIAEEADQLRRGVEWMKAQCG